MKPRRYGLLTLLVILLAGFPLLRMRINKSNRNKGDPQERTCEGRFHAGCGDGRPHPWLQAMTGLSGLCTAWR